MIPVFKSSNEAYDFGLAHQGDENIIQELIGERRKAIGEVSRIYSDKAILSRAEYQKAADLATQAMLCREAVEAARGCSRFEPHKEAV
jgi:hypothetical protein